MALNANKVKGGAAKNRVEQPVLAAGTYPARLVQLIDLGLQPQRAFQGAEKAPAQEIMLTYEFVDEFMVDEKGEVIEDKPRWYSETLPFFNLKADKAKSTQRYNAFDPAGAYEGDFSKALGQPINVTGVQNKSKDVLYFNIATISSMRPKDAEKCPALKNDIKVFDLDAPDMQVFNSLPEWLQTKIKANLRFAGSPLEGLLKGQPVPPKEEAKEDKGPPFEVDDENDNPY